MTLYQLYLFLLPYEMWQDAHKWLNESVHLSLGWIWGSHGDAYEFSVCDAE
jgi:hypothetical protein